MPKKNILPNNTEIEVSVENFDKISSTDYHFKPALIEFNGKSGKISQYDDKVNCYLVAFGYREVWIIADYVKELQIKTDIING